MSSSSLQQLLHFWLLDESPIPRSVYLRHGLSLGFLKYLIDAVVIGSSTGQSWMPWSYLWPAQVALADAPTFVAPTLALWSLPFVWIGVTLTLRRILDAGGSPWWSLLFFVMFVGYLLIAVLCLLPTSTSGRVREPSVKTEGTTPAAALAAAVLAGCAVGLPMSVLSLVVFDSYGAGLFFGAPFCMGVATGAVLERRSAADRSRTATAAILTFVVTGVLALATGFEGAICLLMMMPMGLVLTLLGAILGRSIARAGGRRLRGATAAMALFPLSAALEVPPEPALREVRSAVEIAAPPLDVWEQVVAFPPLAEPEDWMFKLGVAYPMRAEIVGVGGVPGSESVNIEGTADIAGAVRHCVFSTGTFIEPITVWEPGSRLAFDVTASPPPLRELSPYEIAPPHLDGYLVARRGEFRLIAIPGGGTRLEGSTWYEQRLEPALYWTFFSDLIIQRIHRRVLEHIRDKTEARPA